VTLLVFVCNINAVAEVFLSSFSCCFYNVFENFVIVLDVTNTSIQNCASF